MRKHDTNDGLLRHLAAEGEVPDAEALAGRLLATDAGRGAVAGVQAALRAEDLGLCPGSPDAAAGRFFARVQQLEQDAVPAVTRKPIVLRHPSPRRAWGGRLFGAATGLVVLAGLAMFAARTRTPAASPAETASMVHQTGQGQRADLTLPDGSRMVLAPHTRVRYAPGFGKTHRTLLVEGEAYFAVAHHSANVFTVRTAGAVASVLGTAFGIRAYDRDIQLSVATGKIAFSLERALQQSITVTAGHQAQVKGDRIIVDTSSAISDALAWTEGRLVYTDARFADVLSDLQRWFGVRSELEDPALGERRLSGTLQVDAGSRVAVVFVASALGLKYRETAGRVVFYR